jgi:hypothetical protein
VPPATPIIVHPIIRLIRVQDDAAAYAKNHFKNTPLLHAAARQQHSLDTLLHTIPIPISGSEATRFRIAFVPAKAAIRRGATSSEGIHSIAVNCRLSQSIADYCRRPVKTSIFPSKTAQNPYLRAEEERMIEAPANNPVSLELS